MLKTAARPIKKKKYMTFFLPNTCSVTLLQEMSWNVLQKCSKYNNWGKYNS